VAYENGHYLSMPFLALFLFGFGYVGGLSLWQGDIGRMLREMFSRPRPLAPAIPSPIAARIPARRRDTKGVVPAIHLTEDWGGTGSAITLVTGDETSPGIPA
jgi:hypothetical protein